MTQSGWAGSGDGAALVVLRWRSLKQMRDAKSVQGQVAETAWLDLMLLSRGRALVGSFGGHLTRLAYELMVRARRARLCAVYARATSCAYTAP
jgi:hypothetical protein